jgi:hypothetical protein
MSSAQPDLPEWFIRAFTMPRLASYLTVAETDGVPTDAFYAWALQVAEAFYCPLHCLELCLRNAIQRQMSEFYGRVDWWVAAPLAPAAFRKIEKARQQAIQGKATLADTEIHMLTVRQSTLRHFTSPA